MGAWGHGYFENDSALDFMADVEESNDPKLLLQNAIEAGLESEYLEADEGDAVIVAAAYVDRYLNGTRYSGADDDEPLDVDTFPERHPQLNLADLKPAARKALARVIGEDSELNELWQENEEDYPAWRNGVEALINRLS